MKKNLSLLVLCILFVLLIDETYAQNGGVSINTTNAPADPSAMLDVSSTSAPYLGVLIPRMSTANRNSIIAPATGLMVYNTDCGISEYYTGTCWVSTGQNLKAPSPISCSGTTDFCANVSRTFTIPAVTGATTYAWTVPPGATITSGQGTTSAIVVFGNHSGEVCVTAENLCETSQPRCIGLFVNPVPPTPGNITGLTTVARGTTATYFIASVAGAGVYNWAVPSGAIITSGVGTTTVTVSFSCNAVSGNISVNAQSNCGTSSSSTLAITLNPVSANAGPTIMSPGTLGGSPTALGGTSPYTYAWVPSTNLSSTTVANPLTTVCTTTTYTVTVTDASGCTARSSVIASIVNPIPATPGSISGSSSVSCNSSGNIYSIAAVPKATTYAWTVPSGGTITSGQGTTSITTTLTLSGNITVTAGNNCGTSSASTLAVTVTGGSTGSQTFNATSSGQSGTIQTFTIPVCAISLTIEAWGAQGGNSNGGKGAYMKGTFSVSPSQVLQIAVGQQGTFVNYGGGGGGGSFVYNSSTSTLLMVAGGGGGGGAAGSGVDASTGTSGTADQNNANTPGSGGNGGSSGGTWGGAGGGGYNSSGSNGADGTTGGAAWSTLTGGNKGGNYGGYGGYGGGGGATWSSGGGGGYSGGAGANSTGCGGCNYGGGGGGSYNAGTNQTNTSGIQLGNGQVKVTW